MANKKINSARDDKNVLNRMELLALQFLDWEEPSHAYDIEKMIEKVNARQWMDIGFSTIYTILKKLEDKGLVISETIVQDHKPAKVVYRKTKTGNEILKSEVAKLFFNWKVIDNLSYFNQTVFSFYLFNKEEMEELTKKRITAGENLIKKIELEFQNQNKGFSNSVEYTLPLKWVYNHFRDLIKAEIIWLKNWIIDIEIIDWEKFCIDIKKNKPDFL